MKEGVLGTLEVMFMDGRKSKRFIHPSIDAKYPSNKKIFPDAVKEENARVNME